MDSCLPHGGRHRSALTAQLHRKAEALPMQFVPQHAAAGAVEVERERSAVAIQLQACAQAKPNASVNALANNQPTNKKAQPIHTCRWLEAYPARRPRLPGAFQPTPHTRRRSHGSRLPRPDPTIRGCRTRASSPSQRRRRSEVRSPSSAQTNGNVRTTRYLCKHSPTWLDPGSCLQTRL